MNTVKKSDYVLGHSQKEILRLAYQARIIRPITERLLRSVNLGPGKRVLDLGCGIGDVTMLAAELVGPTGLVVGIDRNPEVLTLAKERAYAAGLRQLRYEQATVESFSPEEPFDFVVGRYILVHQTDPVVFLRAAARLVSSGGSIAFHEIDDADDFAALPEVPLWKQANHWLMSALRSLLPNPEVPGRLVDCFCQAGLGVPALFCEVPIGDGERSPIATWLVETLRTLLPQIIQRDWASEDVVDIDSLEKRLRAATSTIHSQVSAPRQVCAWVRVPS